MYSKQRLSILQNKVNYHFKNIPEKHISAEFLFYDDYDKKQKNTKVLMRNSLFNFKKKLVFKLIIEFLNKFYYFF